MRIEKVAIRDGFPNYAPNELEVVQVVRDNMGPTTTRVLNKNAVIVVVVVSAHIKYWVLWGNRGEACMHGVLFHCQRFLSLYDSESKNSLAHAHLTLGPAGTLIRPLLCGTRHNRV